MEMLFEQSPPVAVTRIVDMENNYFDIAGKVFCCVKKSLPG